MTNGKIIALAIVGVLSALTMVCITILSVLVPESQNVTRILAFAGMVATALFTLVSQYGTHAKVAEGVNDNRAQWAEANRVLARHGAMIENDRRIMAGIRAGLEKIGVDKVEIDKIIPAELSSDVMRERRG